MLTDYPQPISEKLAQNTPSNPFENKTREFRAKLGRDPDSEELWEMYKTFSEQELSQLFSRMYFLRHGETVANEQNTFAGRHETYLSELGVEQARQGGRKIAQKGLVFDEIHISPLMRTYETSVILLEELKQQDVRVYVSDQLVERDFGFYSRFNKNLMCKTAGYRAYEDSLHTITGFPPGGETFMEMYRRTMEYYRDILLPKASQGKTILVVCHKYIVEMFAMILAGKPIEEYHDMRLPNAQAMSALELRKFARQDSKLQKEMADRSIFLGPVMIFAAAIAGIILKLAVPMAFEIPRNVLLFSLGGLLAVSSFFVMLSIHTGIVLSAIKTPQFIFSRKMSPWLLRLGLVSAIIFFVDNQTSGCIWLLAAMPPALTVPVFSILWGGNLYAAIRITVLLSCLIPLALPFLFYRLGIDNMLILLPFSLTLLFSIFLPATAAQWIRAKNPIRAGKIVTRWKWLSVIAVVAIAFLSTFYFTPASVLEMSPGQLFFFQKQGLHVFGVMLLLKVFALLNRYIVRDEDPVKTDFHIAQSTPNIFLWLSIVSMLPDTGFLGFWGCLAFSCAILFDEWFFVHKFRINLQHELCRQAENFWQYKRYRGRTPRAIALHPTAEPNGFPFGMRFPEIVSGPGTMDGASIQNNGEIYGGKGGYLRASMEISVSAVKGVTGI